MFVPEYDQLSDQAYVEQLDLKHTRSAWTTFIAEQLMSSVGSYTFTLPANFSRLCLPQITPHRPRILWQTSGNNHSEVRPPTSDQIVADWLVTELFKRFPTLPALLEADQLNIRLVSTIDQLRLNFNWRTERSLRDSIKPFLSSTE